MFMVKINNNYYKMIDTYSLENSSSEMKYSDLKIDFNEGTFNDLPLQYQEIQVLSGDEASITSGNGIVEFLGYLEGYELGTIKTDADFRELKLTLLAPMKLATLRTVNIDGYYDIDTLLDLVLEPLIEEGFTIKVKQVHNRNFTVQYVMQTVEYCMNDISNTKDIFWYINELKEIFIYDISYLTNLEPQLEITEDDIPKGLINITPTLVSVDYANVLDIKNARMYFYSCNGTFVDETRITDFVLTESPKVVQNGDTISFNYPVVIDADNLKKLHDEDASSEIVVDKYGIYIDISLLELYDEDGNELNENDLERIAYAYWSDSQNKFITSDNLSFSDDASEDEETEFVLQRDNFFSNLITGFKWNNPLSDCKGSIVKIYSHSALKYTTAKIFFDEEIEKCKGVISTTGQVEKVVDLNEKWVTQEELIDYAKSLIVENGNTCNEVELLMDIEQDIELGSLVDIDMPNFFVNGQFIVTGIKKEYEAPSEYQYTYTLRNSSLLENYIDFFRASETQSSTSEVDNVIMSVYGGDTIVQTHELEEAEDEN